MERHFILPVTIAAVLHAGLLFGIRRSHSAIADAASPLTKLVDAVTRIEFFPDPPEPAEEAAPQPKGVTSEAPPSFDEQSRPLTASDFPIEIPRRDPTLRVATDKIPIGPIGDILGDDLARHVGPPLARLADLDNTPRARAQTSPVYPLEAKRLGIGAEVVVEFTVEESGVVSNARAVKSTNAMFEESAIRAVSRWRFEPGLRNGRPVRFRMAVPIVFKLDEN